MSSLVRLAALLLLFAGIVSLVGESRVIAQAPLPPMDQEALKKAIDKGVEFLRKSQNPSGSWGPGSSAGSAGGWAVGYTCLAGITLIECGIPNTDPGLKKAASVVRTFCTNTNSKTALDSTYEVSLAILFLDRMRDKQDKKTIEMLASRLIAGQTASGGWGYKVPKIAWSESDQIMSTLKILNPPPPPVTASPWDRPFGIGLCIKMNEETRTKVIVDPPKLDEEKRKQKVASSVPPSLKRYPVFATEDILSLPTPTDKGSDFEGAGTDNSNVHFAMLGLWAARRSQVPVERTFNLVTKRFQQSQASDGSWTYRFYKNGLENGGRGAMTGVALLGLAIGHALNLDRDPKDPDGKMQTERLVDGFVFLSRKVGDAVGSFENRPGPKEVGGLYFLWAMERVAVLYDLPSLGNKDWYRWGAEILIGHQKPDGYWENGGFHGDNPIICSTMALMFLKRANLTNDIPRRALMDADQLAKLVKDKLPAAPSLPPDPPPEVQVAVAPLPREVKAEPKAVPKVATAKAEPAPAPAPKTESGGGMIWIILGIVGLLGLVGLLVFLKKKNSDDEDEEERPRKKKKKGSKAKVKAKS